MIIELGRPELIILCKHIVEHVSISDLLINHKYKDAFKRRDFVNGFHYRLCDTWLELQSQENLFQFYIYHSPTINQINL